MLATSSPLLVEQANLGDAGTTTWAFRQLGLQQAVHMVRWNVGVQAGIVVVESADREDYDGTWNPLATFAFDGSLVPAPKIEQLLIIGPYGAIRHRIDQQIEGGTVTTRVIGQE